jgi:hypothetical protein
MKSKPMPTDPNPPPASSAATSLVNALADLENVAANKTVKANFVARYVSLDVLLDAIKPILHRHGFALRQVLVSEEGRVGVHTSFLHTSGEAFDAGKLMFKADGLTPQQIGSGLTYVRRQSIQTACLISTDLDDDGASASKPAKPAAPPAPWYSFLTAVEAERAHAYLVAKKWLPESADDLAELAKDKIDMILANKDQFLKAIK